MEEPQQSPKTDPEPPETVRQRRKRMSKRIADKDPTLADDPVFQRMITSAAEVAERVTASQLAAPQLIGVTLAPHPGVEAARTLLAPLDHMAGALDKSSASEAEHFKRGHRLEWTIAYLAAATLIATIVGLVIGR
jgi:hypothetical protein